MSDTGRHNDYGYVPDPWHKARLELMAFLIDRVNDVPEEDRMEGWSLYGPEDPAHHICPPWHPLAPLYVMFVRDFIDTQARIIEETKVKFAFKAENKRANANQ